MKQISTLKKQPSWKMAKYQGVWSTGYSGSVPTVWVTDCSVDGPIKHRRVVDRYYEPDLPVPILEGIIKLVGFSRGRSSTIFNFEDEDGNKYSASPKCAYAIFEKSREGVLGGLFTFTKQGSQISIMPYEGS